MDGAALRRSPQQRQDMRLMSCSISPAPCPRRTHALSGASEEMLVITPGTYSPSPLKL